MLFCYGYDSLAWLVFIMFYAVWTEVKWKMKKIFITELHGYRKEERKVNYITYRTIIYFPHKLMFLENANKLNRFSLTIGIIIVANKTQRRRLKTNASVDLKSNKRKDLTGGRLSCKALYPFANEMKNSHHLLNTFR